MFKQYILKHTIKERFTYNGTIGFSHPLQVTWINNQIICMKKGKDFNQFWVLKTKTKELISILTVLRQYYTSDTH